MGRRELLKAGMGTMAALATLAGVTAPLLSLRDGPSLDEFLQRHYTQLTPEMMEKILARIEHEIAFRYGVKTSVRDYKPIPDVEFAYALNLNRCNGSRRCVYACMKENNIPLDHPEQAYIRVVELDNDSLDLEEGNVLYNHDQVPQEGKYYIPIQCQQCRKPPCTKVCPVQATWTEPDGVTVIDYNWCIGCRYCMAACPYEARRFNWSRPKFEPEQINPDMGYLSNRIRPRGVVEKCHFCLHRTRQGKNPACAEACPTGARVFGNIRDPKGKINFILKNKRVYILKADAKTIPRFYYFFDR
ncbi:MAG: 4Fe-4S dicluster domain-containing protein [Candidatus Hydrogenedentes bacterium]|nr:4Fe-4S dicluster domain-containing protein [Candidatus Hydrogenedentota bacterium]